MLFLTVEHTKFPLSVQQLPSALFMGVWPAPQQLQGVPLLFATFCAAQQYALPSAHISVAPVQQNPAQATAVPSALSGQHFGMSA
jgi:hypothetical protein